MSDEYEEAKQTTQAREIIKQMFLPEQFQIEEEVPLLDVQTNNMGEAMGLPYRADMILTKQFIIELDSKKLHGTRKKRAHDKWRDTNVLKQMSLKTVRLLSKDIIKFHKNHQHCIIFQEINHQLKNQQE